MTCSNSRQMWPLLLTVLLASHCSAAEPEAADCTAKGLTGAPWSRHTIDAASRGADGVRLADVNSDGHMDITTGWEQGNVIRICLNPGPNSVPQQWQSFTVGTVQAPEDAVFVDLDSDGAIDVVSACEGQNRTMFVHWAPDAINEYTNQSSWSTGAFPATQGKQAWMFTLPLQVDDCGGIDLIVASKSRGASVGWLQSPKTPRDLAAWKYRKLYAAGWIMSLCLVDLDADGDKDVIASDRKGVNRGVLWLENPGPQNAATGHPWTEHRIGATGREVMFLDVADLDSDGLIDVAIAVKPADIVLLRQSSKGGKTWTSQVVSLPEKDVGTAKAVRVADIDGNGRWELVFSCEHANEGRSGVVWLERNDSISENAWSTHDISGADGIKFDLLQTLDLDHDGDLDVVTCEEAANLGVFWYENPAK